MREMFGNLTDEEYAEMTKEGQQKRKEMLERKEKSPWHFRIPDWTGQGGTIEFWVNDDGSFESEDSRIQDREIRKGIKIFANDWA